MLHGRWSMLVQSRSNCNRTFLSRRVDSVSFTFNYTTPYDCLLVDFINGLKRQKKKKKPPK